MAAGNGPARGPQIVTATVHLRAETVRAGPLWSIGVTTAATSHFSSSVEVPRGAGSQLEAVADAALLRKAGRRLLPLLLVMYLMAYLDRVNIATAALTMNADLGLSATSYGLVSGSFFLGYVVFQVPANWMFNRLGIRRWFAMLLAVWGVAAAAPAFASGPASLTAARIVLGIAEAGFYPAVICYLGRWFPASARARALALFLLAIPLANIIGMPLSSVLVQYGAIAGHPGWRTMFIVEGLPVAALALLALRHLPDYPKNAPWLTDTDRARLARQLSNESSSPTTSFAIALKDRRILTLAAINAGLYFTQFGVQFFLPQILRDLFPHASITLIGIFGALCFAGAGAAMMGWSRHSDRSGERGIHLAAPLLAAAALLAVALTTGHRPLLIISLTATTICVLAALPIFCSITTAQWHGDGAAAAIAAINSIASLASFAGPYAVGYLTATAGGFTPALYVIAATLTCAGALALTISARQSIEPSRQLGGCRPNSPRHSSSS